VRKITAKIWTLFTYILLALKGLFAALGLTAVLHSSGVGILTGVGYVAGTLGTISTALVWLLWWPVILGFFIVALLVSSKDADEEGKVK